MRFAKQQSKIASTSKFCKPYSMEMWKIRKSINICLHATIYCGTTKGYSYRMTRHYAFVCYSMIMTRRSLDIEGKRKLLSLCQGISTGHRWIILLMSTFEVVTHASTTSPSATNDLDCSNLSNWLMHHGLRSQWILSQSSHSLLVSTLKYGW